MKLTLLGTSCPTVDQYRYGPAALVRTDRTSLLIDCGSGVTQRLLEAGNPGCNIDALLITHLHSDHIVDLYQLVVSGWHQGRHAALKVFGPPGTKEYITALMEVWRKEREQRIAHEKRPSNVGLEVSIVELEPGQVLQFNDIRCQVIKVDHRPVRHAFGFAFEADGTKAVFSGDTTYAPTLVEAARGADVLVHEVFIHDELTSLSGGNRSLEGTRNVASYHTLSDVVGKVAHEADVGCLILTHFVPPRFDRGGLLAQVRADYAGPVIIGEDLLDYDTVSREISYMRLVLGLPETATASRNPQQRQQDP